jgi:DinB superfamily
MKLEDVIAALSEMPDFLIKSRLAKLSDARLHFQPEGGYFSILENICHLRDIEIEGYSLRLQRLLAEQHPILPNIDGGQLAQARRYNQQTLQPALNDFIQARNKNLKLLATLTTAQLARSGYLEPTGEITLGRLLELWVEHDHGHIQELEKLRAMGAQSQSGARTQETPA